MNNVTLGSYIKTNPSVDLKWGASIIVNSVKVSSFDMKCYSFVTLGTKDFFKLIVNQSFSIQSQNPIVILPLKSRLNNSEHPISRAEAHWGSPIDILS